MAHLHMSNIFGTFKAQMGKTARISTTHQIAALSALCTMFCNAHEASEARPASEGPSSGRARRLQRATCPMPCTMPPFDVAQGIVGNSAEALLVRPNTQEIISSFLFC